MSAGTLDTIGNVLRNIHFFKGNVKVHFASCFVTSVAVKSLCLHFYLSLGECRAAALVPHRQTGAYPEHLVPLEEFAAASQLWSVAALSAATGHTSPSNTPFHHRLKQSFLCDTILWIRIAKPLKSFSAVVATIYRPLIDSAAAV